VLDFGVVFGSSKFVSNNPPSLKKGYVLPWMLFFMMLGNFTLFKSRVRIFILNYEHLEEMHVLPILWAITSMKKSMLYGSLNF